MLTDRPRYAAEIIGTAYHVGKECIKKKRVWGRGPTRFARFLKKKFFSVFIKPSNDCNDQRKTRQRRNKQRYKKRNHHKQIRTHHL
nr:MAG TPA: hypothetical protein [Microviridae sp.]